MTDSARQLQGLQIVVTRPQQQANKLVKLLEKNGADILRLPVLEIKSIKPDAGPSAFLHHPLAYYDYCIFISANAVKYANSISPVPWPIKVQVAVGKATARAMLQQGFRVDAHPIERWDSEALLELTEFQAQLVHKKNILIVRGVGGREHLADTLRLRGANVDYAEVYQRVCPNVDTQEIVSALHKATPMCIILTSLQGLKNLQTLMAEHFSYLCNKVTPVVVSERIAKAVIRAGFLNKPVIAKRADNNSLMIAIKHWWLQ